MSLWSLIPVKSLHEGKGRLASVLDPAARREFNTFLLDHTLDVMRAFPGPERTCIVSSDEEVLDRAAAFGASVIHQRTVPGLNAALTMGLAALREKAQAVMIVPVDLPLLTEADMREVAASGPHCGAVLCPDRTRRGTNCLLLRGMTDFEFGFGDNSFELHCRRVRLMGETPHTIFNERIAFDVDRPEDLERLRTHTQEQGSLVCP